MSPNLILILILMLIPRFGADIIIFNNATRDACIIVASLLKSYIAISYANINQCHVFMAVDYSINCGNFLLTNKDPKAHYVLFYAETDTGNCVWKSLLSNDDHSYNWNSFHSSKSKKENKFKSSLLKDDYFLKLNFSLFNILFLDERMEIVSRASFSGGHEERIEKILDFKYFREMVPKADVTVEMTYVAEKKVNISVCVCELADLAGMAVIEREGCFNRQEVGDSVAPRFRYQVIEAGKARVKYAKYLMITANMKSDEDQVFFYVSDDPLWMYSFY